MKFELANILKKTRVVFEFSGRQIPSNQIDKKQNALTILFGEKKIFESIPQKETEAPIASDEMKVEKRDTKSRTDGTRTGQKNWGIGCPVIKKKGFL